MIFVNILSITMEMLNIQLARICLVEVLQTAAESICLVSIENTTTKRIEILKRSAAILNPAPQSQDEPQVSLET